MVTKVNSEGRFLEFGSKKWHSYRPLRAPAAWRIWRVCMVLYVCQYSGDCKAYAEIWPPCHLHSHIMIQTSNFMPGNTNSHSGGARRGGDGSDTPIMQLGSAADFTKFVSTRAKRKRRNRPLTGEVVVGMARWRSHGTTGIGVGPPKL